MIRPIEINVVLNGFVVKVGCQTVVFNNIPDLIDKLNQYLRTPEIIEKEFASLPNARHTYGNNLVEEARSTARDPQAATGQFEAVPTNWNGR